MSKENEAPRIVTDDDPGDCHQAGAEPPPAAKKVDKGPLESLVEQQRYVRVEAAQKKAAKALPDGCGVIVVAWDPISGIVLSSGNLPHVLVAQVLGTASAAAAQRAAHEAPQIVVPDPVAAGRIVRARS